MLCLHQSLGSPGGEVVSLEVRGKGSDYLLASLVFVHHL